MKTKMIALMLLLSACGTKEKAIIDPAFNSYVQDFEAKVGVPVSGVDIMFKPTEYPAIGVCYQYSSGKNKIEVDPTRWASMDEYGREQLMYHELGHCVLGMRHNDAEVSMGGWMVEGSIMNSYWFGNAWYYLKWRENYKQAMKNNTLVKE